MGREIRMVPPDWQHPANEGYRNGKYKPLYYGAGGRYEAKAKAWLDGLAKWQAGERPDYAGDDAPAFFWDWDGNPPSADDHMLVGVPDEACTHFMLYESTSEGTPLSPAFVTLEAVAIYAAEYCSTFASFKATSEEWLRMLSPGSPGVMTEIAPGIVAI
jgi:hypothetical protein